MKLKQIEMSKEYTQDELKKFLFKTITDLNMYLQILNKESKNNG